MSGVGGWQAGGVGEWSRWVGLVSGVGGWQVGGVGVWGRSVEQRLCLWEEHHLCIQLVASDNRTGLGHKS